MRQIRLDNRHLQMCLHVHDYYVCLCYEITCRAIGLTRYSDCIDVLLFANLVVREIS